MSAPPAEVPNNSPYPPPIGASPYPPGGPHGEGSPYPPPPGIYPAPGPYPPPIVTQPAPGMYPPPPGTTPYPHPVGDAYVPPAGQQPYGVPPPAPQVMQPAVDFRGGLAVPPGLEYLTMIDQLLVHQKVELLEAFTGFETNNKYEVKNSMGQQIYKANEDTDCCTRNCCGPSRPFDMKISDNVGNEVIHLYRPLRCDSCCCPCCLQELEVTAPPGTIVGYVVQQWSICKPLYHVQNAAKDTVLQIEGPICTFGICGADVEFKVLSADGLTQVGKITKQWSGLAKELFTDADNFGITFPLDLDVNIKAVLLGACFLIDFMFFEKQQNKESDRPGMADL